MIDTLLDVVKTYLIPGTIPFLLFAAAPGIVLLYGSKKLARWGRSWLLGLFLVYWFISAPLGSAVLEAGLASGFLQMDDPRLAGPIDAIVVLGGGSINIRARGITTTIVTSETALRVMEGIRLYHLLEDPLVIVSGGRNESMAGGRAESELMAQLMVREGVPPQAIIQEPLSGSTLMQAEELGPILRRHQVRRFLLVTSPLHMRRALAVFRNRGLDAVPAPSASHSEGLFPNRWSILPSSIALDASAAAMREYLATAYYWARGWLAAP
jgi:uncharacterized SAM-binding protein YcdF (DUF218 family)